MYDTPQVIYEQVIMNSDRQDRVSTGKNMVTDGGTTTTTSTSTSTTPVLQHILSQDKTAAETTICSPNAANGLSLHTLSNGKSISASVASSQRTIVNIEENHNGGCLFEEGYDSDGACRPFFEVVEDEVDLICDYGNGEGTTTSSNMGRIDDNQGM